MSTFRAQLRAGCKTVIDSVQTANPTLIAHTYDHRPAKFLTPCAFVDFAVDQTIAHDSGTRRRVFTAFVHIVNKLISNDQAADEQDVLVDLVVDAFTAQPRAASNSTLIEPTGVTTHAEETDGANYACSIVAVSGLILEGRA